ncbi:Rap1a/Tai family immunity protein [Marinobacter sp. 1_MG-2023]|uniref:Rap1a/Tai family immunity protein n=1 Tax=Marinobacter sp. 1_MG-2023 TaxID=3062627 RepID=UPI0026E33536|nr:Rap1a/Tai family immunity protein [Marinobacter sp. 1_MG-2023]MDO6825611.1 Rap1a/Tai family immunity protein [Marinobacter sp. 1_MG-2023]
MYWRIVILLLMVSSSFFVKANSIQNNGNSLLKECGAFLHLLDKGAGNKDPYGAGICVGYVQGATDFNFVQAATKGEGNFCIPQEVAFGQKVRVLVKYLRDNPATLHEPQVLLVIKAFRESFPCQ